MITGYVILDSQSRKDLTDAVISYLANGWRPVGGIAITNVSVGCVLFAQALVYEKPGL